MHRISKIRTSAGAGVAAAALAFTGAAASQASVKKAHAAGGTTTITLAIPAAAPEYALPAIATANHLFPKNLKVNYQILPGAQILAALSSGHADMGFAASPNAESLAASGSKSIQWLAQSDYPSDFWLIARPNFTSMKQLVGKPIAVTTPGSATDYLGYVAFEKSGLGRSAFNPQPDTTIPTILSQFQSGNADGMVISASVVQGLVSSGKAKILYDFDKTKYPWSGAGVIGYMPWVKSNPQAVVGFLQGLQKAQELVHKNPKAADKAMGQFVDAPATSSTVRSDVSVIQKLTPKSLVPTPKAMVVNALNVLKANGVPGASPSLAAGLINNTYITKALAGLKK